MIPRDKRGMTDWFVWFVPGEAETIVRRAQYPWPRKPQ